FVENGRRYYLEQVTQRKRLGIPLPTACLVLAWIYERLMNWTDGYLRDDDEG
ncbi:hypothetical protein JAAARDRAFT_115097, partial [Jaapia argillacea MUCL 33604]